MAPDALLWYLSSTVLDESLNNLLLLLFILRGDDYSLLINWLFLAVVHADENPLGKDLLRLLVSIGSNYCYSCYYNILSLLLTIYGNWGTLLALLAPPLVDALILLNFELLLGANL